MTLTETVSAGVLPPPRPPCGAGSKLGLGMTDLLQQMSGHYSIYSYGAWQRMPQDCNHPKAIRICIYVFLIDIYMRRLLVHIAYVVQV
jgi:hypothetical protein